MAAQKCQFKFVFVKSAATFRKRFYERPPERGGDSMKRLKWLLLPAWFLLSAFNSETSTTTITGSTVPIPSDIHIDADIQAWGKAGPQWSPNVYELQILREIQKKPKTEYPMKLTPPEEAK